jgi:hypothetical protein
VAARCNAVVVAMRDDDDALQYLGDDYPLYVRGPDPALLEADMAERSPRASAAPTGAGPRRSWRRSRPARATRSSGPRFAAMVAALAG